jgi:hypothetical protein
MGVRRLLRVAGYLALAAGLLVLGLRPPVGRSTLPDTEAQQALVRRYIDLVAAGQYADAWQLLTPERQGREPTAQFAAAWRSWGQVQLEPGGGPFIWPAAVDEVRANVWLQPPSASGGVERVIFELAHVGGAWWIAEERGRGHRERILFEPPGGSPAESARRYVARNVGPMWLATMDLLHQEPFEAGQVVVFRMLDPLVDRAAAAGPKPVAVLVFARPVLSGWEMAGGGAIGTIAEMERYAVACGWTWLRFVADEPAAVAFYCTVEDARVAAVELVRVDGAVQRADAAGRRAIVFPHASALRPGGPWPAQQPREIRLFDSDGRPLDLPVSPVADETARRGVSQPRPLSTGPGLHAASGSERSGPTGRLGGALGRSPTLTPHVPQLTDVPARAH